MSTNTISNERLSTFAILYIESDRDVDFDQVIDEFD